MKRFQIKIFNEHYDNIPEDKRSYIIVADDLINSGIFDDNDADIIHNPTRKVLTNEEMAEIQVKKGKKKNDIVKQIPIKIGTTLHYAMVNQNNVKISHRKYIC